MTDIALSKLVGNKVTPKLAPSSPPSNGVYDTVTGIDATGGLTQILSLTGKFILSHISFTGVASGDMVKLNLKIDGVNIFNENPYTPPSGTGTGFGLIGGASATTTKLDEAYLVESSLQLFVQMSTDNDITLNYLVRPIL